MHYSDDELTLYYYGESRRSADVERHLQECPACAALYREIAGTLAMVVADEIPERGDQYGLEVWQRVRHTLHETDTETGSNWFKRLTGFFGTGFDGFTKVAAFGAAAAVLMIAAFIVGRSSAPSNQGPATASIEKPVNPVNRLNPDEARERILVGAIADHLDRSARVLTDIMNAPDAQHGGDISAEQRWAEDLVATGRLYRQDAIDAGEQSVANVLDDLERNLLDIVHSPSNISATDLEQIRRRIDAAALLFKVRVMGDELRRREAAPSDRATPRTSTTASKIS